MKKIIFLAPLLFLPTSHAADFDPGSSAMCIQVITPAVSPHGECQIFPTPCDVPSDWKKISSCDLVKPAESGLDIRDVEERRRQSRAEWARKAVQLQKPAVRNETSQPRFVGRALFTKRRGDENQRLDQDSGNSFLKSRSMRNMPRLSNTEALETYRPLNLDTMAGIKKPGELTDLQKYQQRILEAGQRRPSFMSSTEMEREGYMSTDSFYTQRGMKEEPTGERAWRGYESMRYPKLAKRKAGKIELSKVWKGPRLQGDLGGKKESK